MAKAIIVDDEYHIREGIRTSLPWKELNIDRVWEADDAHKALALAREASPDIYLLDINIPGMNGIELAKRIREMSAEAQIIFLTGYDDFALAKQAVTLNAVDYLLKPVRYGELCDTLRKAVERIHLVKDRNAIVESLNQKVSEIGKMASDQIFLELLHHQRLPADCLKRLAELGIEISPIANFGVLSIEIENGHADGNSALDRQLYHYAYRKLMQEVTESWGVGYVVNEKPQTLVVLLVEPARSSSTFLSFAKEVQEAYKRFLKRTVSIGISEIAHGLASIHEAYMQSQKALQTRPLIGSGQIVPFTFVHADRVSASSSSLLGKELQFFSALRGGSEANISKYFEAWATEVSMLPWKDVRLLASHFSFTLLRLVTEAGCSSELGEHPLVRIAECTSFEQIKYVLHQDVSQAALAISRSRETPTIKLIQDAKKWVKENLSSEVSLTSLAEHLHLSPNYLSQLFKQSAGETFIDFVTRVRIEKAKELLGEGHLKNYQIAEQIGFTDANYFSLIFKKHTGYTPTEYRHYLQ